MGDVLNQDLAAQLATLVKEQEFSATAEAKGTARVIELEKALKALEQRATEELQVSEDAKQDLNAQLAKLMKEQEMAVVADAGASSRVAELESALELADRTLQRNCQQ